MMASSGSGVEVLADLVHEVYSHKPQQTLFHYTSLAGVLGIVREGALFATEIRYMSDASELSVAVSLLQRFARERLESTTLDPEILTQFTSWVEESFVDGAQLFVTCFSEQGDLLSQWRGYCPNGEGICLGFRPADVEQAAEVQHFRLVRCIYNGEEQNRLSQQIVMKVEAYAHAVGPSQETLRLSRHGGSSYFPAFNSLSRQLLLLAAAFKSRAFSEEQEWRVVSFAPEPDPAQINFRKGHSMLVPFIGFSLPKSGEGSLLIASGRVGPTPHRDLAMRSLLGLIRTRVLRDYWVMASDIPYRTW
jgi:hypothetical protein